MATVVLVQRNPKEAARCADWLSGQGHTLVECEGPQPPDFRCAFLRRGACHLWEVGDLFVYDAWLDASRDEANSEALIGRLRLQYPDRPLILVGPGKVTPTWVESLARRDPLVRPVFPATREGLVAAVAAMLAAARTVTRA